MKNMNKQHVQLPNNMTLDVKPKDLLIYVTIKRHMNKETKKAFPALTTICAESGASINSVRSSIKNLVEHEYLKVEKDGKKNVYVFTSYKNFEPFSYDFLDQKDLSYEEKSYIIAAQQYMFKDVEGEGKISMSNKELATKINTSERSIIKYNKSLERKGFLLKIPANLKELESGCCKEIKIFDLNKMLQQIIWVLQNHEERITINENDISLIKERLNSYEKENKLLKEELTKLKQKDYNNYIL